MVAAADLAVTLQEAALDRDWRSAALMLPPVVHKESWRVALTQSSSYIAHDVPERCNAHILLDILPFSDSWESVEGTSHTIGSGRGSRTNSHDCFMPRRARLRLTAPHADARHSTLEISIFCSDFFWSSRTVDNIIYSNANLRLC